MIRLIFHRKFFLVLFLLLLGVGFEAQGNTYTVASLWQIELDNESALKAVFGIESSGLTQIYITGQDTADLYDLTAYPAIKALLDSLSLIDSTLDASNIDAHIELFVDEAKAYGQVVVDRLIGTGEEHIFVAIAEVDYEVERGTIFFYDTNSRLIVMSRQLEAFGSKFVLIEVDESFQNTVQQLGTMFSELDNLVLTIGEIVPSEVINGYVRGQLVQNELMQIMVTLQSDGLSLSLFNLVPDYWAEQETSAEILLGSSDANSQTMITPRDSRLQLGLLAHLTIPVLRPFVRRVGEIDVNTLIENTRHLMSDSGEVAFSRADCEQGSFEQYGAYRQCFIYPTVVSVPYLALVEGIDRAGNIVTHSSWLVDLALPVGGRNLVFTGFMRTEEWGVSSYTASTPNNIGNSGNQMDITIPRLATYLVPGRQTQMAVWVIDNQNFEDIVWNDISVLDTNNRTAIVNSAAIYISYVRNGNILVQGIQNRNYTGEDYLIVPVSNWVVQGGS